MGSINEIKQQTKKEIRPLRQSIEGLERKSVPILDEINKINTKINKMENEINGKLDIIFEMLKEKKFEKL